MATTMFPKYSKKREGVNFVNEQKLLQNASTLILNSETCTGCGVCVEACPE
jgi:4Fe-4S ferredoxin